MAEHSSETAIELVELIEHMINHGSSLNMNWGEDTGGYEVDWITSGKRFHGYDRNLTKAMEQAIRSARTHFEDGETPLSAKEQDMIDAAWQTHRDALNLADQQPSDRPKTLLDGFGEATEQVVALRAEVERLRAAVDGHAEVTRHWIEATRHWIKQAHAAQAEVERLRDLNARQVALVEQARSERDASDAENERLRAALLGITQCLGEGACKQLNCPGCQHEMREAADLARAALAPRSGS